MPPLISEEQTDVMSSGDESDAEHMIKEMLKDICYGSQYCPSVNRIEAYYKKRDCILKSQVEWKEVFLSTRNMVKGLHKIFKAVVNYILQFIEILG